MILLFLLVFTVAIRPCPPVFTIVILPSLREPLGTVATFVASASRVPTPALVPAPSAVSVQEEWNEAPPLGGKGVSAAAASVEEAPSVVQEECVVAADVAGDGIELWLRKNCSLMSDML